MTSVAFGRYEGNHPDGRDYPRKGDLAIAQIAHQAYREGLACVKRIPPSRVGCRQEKSSFGRVYAFRIVDEAAFGRFAAQR